MGNGRPLAGKARVVEFGAGQSVNVDADKAEQRGLAEKGTALNGNSPRKWNDTCDTTGR